jgi:hypothetical protein
MGFSPPSVVPVNRVVGLTSMAGAAIVIFGCGSPASAGDQSSRRCADLFAQALTSPNQVVPGTFGCMSGREQNFWHRWAVSRDDQLTDVVRSGGLTRAGLVEGFDPTAHWTRATYVTDLKPSQRLYVVQDAEFPSVRALLVVATDGRGRVDDFVLQTYER